MNPRPQNTKHVERQKEVQRVIEDVERRQESVRRVLRELEDREGVVGPLQPRKDGKGDGELR